MTTEAMDADCLPLTRTLRRRGGAVLAVFALVWALAGGSGAVTGAGFVVVAVVACAVSAGAVVSAYRGAAGPVTRLVRLPKRWNRWVALVNTAEVAGIVAVIAAANALERPELIPVGIGLVVGLHFFPLRRLYDQWQYRWTGSLLTAVALVGLAVLAAGGTAETTRAVVGFGSALVLWGSAFHVALRG